MAGASGDTRQFLSRLASLFWELQETIQRKFKDDVTMSYQKMQDILFPSVGKPKFDEALEVWKHINLMLGEINLTRVDTKKDYDSTDIEEENRVQSL